MHPPLALAPRHNDAATLLDGIRVAASQLVLVGHAIAFFRVCPALNWPRVPYMQNVAVVWFFLISGFLIAFTLRKRLAEDPAHRFSGYFAARVGRIYAGYLPALLFVAAVDQVLVRMVPAYPHAAAYDVKTFVGNLFMLQDTPFCRLFSPPITSFGSARPFWTLAVEMWIYLFVGAVVLFVHRLTPLRAAAIGLFAAVPLVNLWGGRGVGLFGIWLLGAGVEWILSAGWLSRWRSFALAALGLLASATWAIIIWRHKSPYVRASYPPLAVAFLALLALSFRGRATVSRPTLQRVVAYLAGYSFTLYLTHYTILTAMVLLPIPLSAPARFWISVVGANVIALVLAQFTERRHKQLAAAIARRLAPAAAVSGSRAR